MHRKSDQNKQRMQRILDRRKTSRPAEPSKKCDVFRTCPPRSYAHVNGCLHCHRRPRRVPARALWPTCEPGLLPVVAGAPLRKVSLPTGVVNVACVRHPLAMAGTGDLESGTRGPADWSAVNEWSGTTAPSEGAELGPWSGTERPKRLALLDAAPWEDLMDLAMNLQSWSGYSDRLAVFHFPSVLFLFGGWLNQRASCSP
jgi:hypothetical protein